MVDSKIEINIIRALNEQNAWWREGKPSEKFAKKFRRRDFFPLRNELEKKEITAIIGQRQVGKTTVLYQLIETLIKDNKVSPKNILYFSFDNPYISITKNNTENLINDILEVFSVNILKEPLNNPKEKIYVFFDEICKYPGWSEILKGLYDLKYPIKFFISDSSSSDVYHGSSESLVGRMKIHIMLSLKFLDYARYKIGTTESKILNMINWELRDNLINSVKNGKVKDIYDFWKNVYSFISPIENQLKTYLNEYLLKDGFPELIEIDSLDECRLKLHNYLTLTLQKDLLRIFNIRNPRALTDLISLIASESSQIFVYSNISKTLSISDDTLKEYLSYLESVFLVSRAEFYSKSRASRIRKSDKIYLNNVALRNVLLNKLNDDFFKDPKDVGKVAESLVQDHCKRLKFCIDLSPDPDIFYWKNNKGNEVDLILEISNKPLPIEVKYRNSISMSDLKGINTFISVKKSSFGFVITKDLLDIKDTLIFVPLWLFLLIC